MGSAAGFRSSRHRGWWRLSAGAALLALAAVAAWSWRENLALRDRVALLERENQSLRQAAPARPAAAPPPAAPLPAAVATPPPGPSTAAPRAVDPLAGYARPPASAPRQAPLEEALQRLREPVPAPGTSPFGRRSGDLPPPATRHP